MARLNTRTTTRTTATTRSSSSRPSDAELHKMIERKAYELFERKGHQGGNAWSDWFEAERIVKRQHNLR